MSICAKDLANHITDMLIFYSEASQRSSVGLYMLGGGYNHPPKRNRPWKNLPPEIPFNFLKT